MDKILLEFGKDAFRGLGRVFNRSIFDALVGSISEGVQEGTLKNNLRQEYEYLINDSSFQETLSGSTTDARRVKLRIKLAKIQFLIK